MADRVYIVTSGEYGSYGIDAVYATRADAQACIERGVGENIEEWPLYGPGDRSYRKRGLHFATMSIHPDGRTELTHEWDATTCGDHEVAPYESSQVSLDVEGFYTLTVAAGTAEAARKAAREQAAQVAAQMADGLNPVTLAEARAQERFQQSQRILGVS